MRVFKLYFQIIRKHLGQISIYAFVFLAVAIVYANTSPVAKLDKFSEEKNRVVFINEDQDSILVSGLKEYLGHYSVFVNISNDSENLQDALFFRDAEYILKIPSGFTQAFMKGDKTALEKTSVPDSSKGIFTDMLADNYLNNARLYLGNVPDITQEELVDEVKKNIAVQTTVEMNGKRTLKSVNASMGFFFNYLAYYLLGVLVLGVSTIMMVLNEMTIKRRNMCAPVKSTWFNTQILLGNIVFTLAALGLMILASFAFYKSEMFSTNALLYSLNALVFALTALSMSFLLGMVIKSKSAQAGISNILTLCMCFLSGVFVPQDLSSKQVLSLAAFTPTYWYVKGNNGIAQLTHYSFQNLSPLFNAILIQVGFMAAMISIALVLGKRKPANSN